MPGRDTNLGAKRARQARAELGLDPAAPLPCVLTAVEEAAGVPVGLVAFGDGIAGYCWRGGDRVILWVNGSHSAPRQRFTLAHEFGHLRCGHDGALPPESVETLGGKVTSDVEIQANAFAAEFLAPAVAVRERVTPDPSLEDVVRLAAHFGISTIAALYRLNTLGLAPRYATLKDEIEEGLDTVVWHRLDPPTPEDLIAAVSPARLPRLSPTLRGSALGAALDGSASVDDAAACAGCDPATLADGVRVIGA